MPRKAASRKAGSRSAKKTTEDVPPEQDSSPSKSKEESEMDRSRRSSTAAQTAASVAESRVTRTRSSRQDSTSPSEGRRTREVQSSRVRSSRRGAGRINYRESDGEEEIPQKKTDNAESSEEYESDSDEKNKPKAKKIKSPAKPRGSATKSRGRGRGGGRGRAGRRKTTDSIEEQDELETADLSEDKVDAETDPVTNKSKDEEVKKKPSPLKSEAKTPEARSSRKSSRGSVSKSEEPTSRRPSRNKEVKKYTEIDEDEEESEEEIKEKQEPSRKRKREPEDEPNKRPKTEENQDVSKELVTKEQEVPDDKPKSFEEKVESKDEEEEPMEIDEVVSDPELAKTNIDEAQKEQNEKIVEDHKSVDEPKLNDSVSHKPSEKSAEVQSVESNHGGEKQESDEKMETKEIEVAQDLSLENKSNAPGVIKCPEKEIVKPEEKKEDSQSAKNCVEPAVPSQSVIQENTFLSKDPVVNEKSDKESSHVDAVDKSKSFLYQNSTALKTNGTHENDQQVHLSKKTLAGREYIQNKSLSIDLRKSLKDMLHVGFSSYNLSSSNVHKEKLVRELDENMALICLQNVSKSLFHDVLESHLDALGFKAIVSLPEEGSLGLVIFYKASMFRLNKYVEAPVQKIIQTKLGSSDLDESEKAAVSDCLNRCGNVLFAHLASIHKNVSFTVANVKIPSSSVSLHALQIACLSHELFAVSEPANRRVLLCGEFNLSESEISYQLLRHGKLEEQNFEDLSKDPESSQSAPVVKLLRNISQSPSMKLASCYSQVLGKEVTIPESNMTSPDLLFISTEDIHTLGILNLPSNYAEKLGQGLIPLEADIAIATPLSQKPV